MIKYPPKNSLRSAPRKQAICSSDHKAAQLFVKGIGFSKDAELKL